MIRLNIGAAILLLSATSANSLQLSCELASGVDVVRTLKITVAADDKVNVWKRSEASTGLTFMPEHERNPKVLFHYKPNYMGPNTSVIVVENRDDERKDITYPPTIYIINWAKAKLAEVTVPAGTEPPGQVQPIIAFRPELVINLRTAKALNLDIPPTLLARADEVIE